MFSPYVGEAEAEIRRAFTIARQASPCVLFLDELDALVTNRDTGAGNGKFEGGNLEISYRFYFSILVQCVLFHVGWCIRQLVLIFLYHIPRNHQHRT